MGRFVYRRFCYIVLSNYVLNVDQYLVILLNVYDECMDAAHSTGFNSGLSMKLLVLRGQVTEEKFVF